MSANGFVPALGFHLLTPLYDSVVRATTRERTFKRALIEQAAVAKDNSVLDLACGTGTLAVALARSGAQVHGIDADPRMLERAQHKAESAGVRISFERGSATALPYPDRSYDHVLSTLFFHHLSWDEKLAAANEARRVLRPGGVLHIADWGRAANPLMRVAFVGIQLLDGFVNTADNVSGKLTQVMQIAGYTDIAETRRFATMFGTLSLYRAVRPMEAT